MSLQADLSEIDDWLTRHAPRTSAMLHPPAAPEQLAALEASLGLTLVPEVAAVLRWHNGPPSVMWPGLEKLCSDLRTALVHRQPLMNCVSQIVDGAVEWVDDGLAES